MIYSWTKILDHNLLKPCFRSPELVLDSRPFVFIFNVINANMSICDINKTCNIYYFIVNFTNTFKNVTKSYYLTIITKI